MIPRPSVLYQSIRYGLVTLGLFGVRWWLDSETANYASSIWNDAEWLLLADSGFSVALAVMLLGAFDSLMGRKGPEPASTTPAHTAEPTVMAQEGNFLLEQPGLSFGVVQGQLFYRAGQPPDLKLLQANSYFESLMEAAVHDGPSALESWLGIPPDKMVLLSEESWMAWQPGTPFEFDAWIPTLGKTLKGHIIPRPEGRFWGLFVDVTDLRLQEQNVVQLSKLLNKYKENSKIRTASFLDETELFLYAIVHNLNEARDVLSLTHEFEQRHQLERLTETIMLYAWTLRLTYNVQLTDLNELVRNVLLTDTIRLKADRIQCDPLPQVVLSNQVVTIALSNLIEALLDATPSSCVIHLSKVDDFLDTLFLLSVDNVNFDVTSERLQNDLRFSLGRQLIIRHGGRLNFHEGVNGLHVEFVLGKPYPGLPVKQS